jgi:hypothetical protein
VHGAYLAIEEFSGGKRRGVILLPEGKEKWVWCGFGKVQCFLLKPFFAMKQTPPKLVLLQRSFRQTTLV